MRRPATDVKPRARRRSPKRRRQDAYHEAGHAVAALAQGIEVSRISVLPIGTTRGRCFHGPVTDARAELVILWAGYVAEAICGVGRVKPCRSMGSDLPVAERLIDQICPNGSTIERDELHLAAIGSATAILRRWWAVVVSLANQLETAEEIDGAAVRATLARFGAVFLGDER
jgi:hypothetical protein